MTAMAMPAMPTTAPTSPTSPTAGAAGGAEEGPAFADVLAAASPAPADAPEQSPAAEPAHPWAPVHAALLGAGTATAGEEATAVEDTPATEESVEGTAAELLATVAPATDGPQPHPGAGVTGTPVASETAGTTATGAPAAVVPADADPTAVATGQRTTGTDIARPLSGPVAAEVSTDTAVPSPLAADAATTQTAVTARPAAPAADPAAADPVATAPTDATATEVAPTTADDADPAPAAPSRSAGDVPTTTATTATSAPMTDRASVTTTETAAAASRTPDLPAPAGAQVASAVAALRRHGDGTYTASLELHPAELGSVHVDVEIRAGVVNVVLSPEQQGTRALMASQIAELREALQQAGLETGSLDVSSQSRQDGRDDDGQPTGGDRQRAGSADRPVVLPPLAVSRQHQTDTSVDMRV